MTLLKLTLITLLSTFMYAAESGHEGHDHEKGEHQQKAQKSEGIYYGTILEIKDAKGYTYLKINEKGKELWIAIASAPVKVGDRIGYDKRTLMRDFKSKSLNKTFKEIFFASDVALPQNVQRPKSMKEMLGLSPKEQNPHASMGKGMPPKEEERTATPFVQKDMYTVEEVHMWRKSLEGQAISVVASVSKVSRQIMKLDWVHLGDGTGNEKKQTNDLIFTAVNAGIETGDKVIAKGKVIVNKDFGFGYFYKVIIQDATFRVK